MAASKTAKAWNMGMTGEPKPPQQVQTAARCATVEAAVRSRAACAASRAGS